MLSCFSLESRLWLYTSWIESSLLRKEDNANKSKEETTVEIAPNKFKLCAVMLGLFSGPCTLLQWLVNTWHNVRCHSVHWVRTSAAAILPHPPEEENCFVMLHPVIMASAFSEACAVTCVSTEKSGFDRFDKKKSLHNFFLCGEY